MYRIVQTPIVAPTQANQWSQVVVNTHQNVVVVFSMTGEKASDFGHVIVNECMALEIDSALQLHQQAESMIYRARELNLQLNLAMGVFLEQRCVFAASAGSIRLFRQKKFGNLLSSTEGLKVIEGTLQPDDIFIFGTLELDRVAPLIQQELSHGADIELLTTSLISHIDAQTPLGLAMSIVRLHPVVTGATVVAEEVAKPNELPAQQQPGTSRLKKTRYVFATKIFQLSHYFSSDDPVVRSARIRKTAAAILMLCIVTFGGVGVVFYRSYDIRRQTQQAERITQPADQKIDAIKQIVGQDPLAARQQTQDVLSSLQDGLTQVKRDALSTQLVQQKINSVQAFYQSISGEQQLDVLPTFFNLRLVQSDFIANKMDIFGKTLLFLDLGQKKVLALDSEKKQPTQLPIGDYTNLRDFSFDGKTMYFLGDGISKVDIVANVATPSAQLKPSDDSNRAATSIRTFNKNVYLLNLEKQNIFRYAPGDNGTYSDPIGWFHGSPGIDFSQVASFTVDGDVWLGTKDGKIFRYSAGKQSDFTINGLKDPMSTPVTVFTQDGLNNIYVLEPQKDRVLVISKHGDFLKEVKSKSLGAATALVADEAQQKIYVLSGSMVFEIKL